MKLLKAKEIETENSVYTDVYIMDILDEKMLNHKIKQGDIIQLFDGETFINTNSKYLYSYILYDEKVDIPDLDRGGIIG